MNGVLTSLRGSVVQQVDTIIRTAVANGVSDIHLEPYENEFRVRYRLDGMLHTAGMVPVARKDAFISRLKIMASLDIAEKRRPQDGRIRTDCEGRTVDLRLSTLPTDFGEKTVLRILDQGRQRLSLDSLGFEAETLERFRQAIRHPYGMILVTGPTGSGKTTTLYAALQELNDPSVNITTIEDPVEYHLEGINQTQVRSDIGVTFLHALRSILRQDPDIIMVGEIRDRETAEIAIRSALTGHLVLSTLHTNDAPSAIARLLDMGIEPFLIASSVRAVLAQRLVRTICPRCAVDRPAGSTAVALDMTSKEMLREGPGCKHCSGSGYRGRTGLMELMHISNRLAAMISRGDTPDRLRARASTEGMNTLREAGIRKIHRYKTTPEEVLRVTDSA